MVGFAENLTFSKSQAFWALISLSGTTAGISGVFTMCQAQLSGECESTFNKQTNWIPSTGLSMPGLYTALAPVEETSLVFSGLVLLFQDQICEPLTTPHCPWHLCSRGICSGPTNCYSLLERAYQNTFPSVRPQILWIWGTAMGPS